jgi:putative nucleotidyltransferase-like protein
MPESRRPTRGVLVAETLRKSWATPTSSEPELAQSQLDQVTPLLYGSGAAGLAWWRIRETDLRESASGEMLHQAFRLLALQGAIHENKIRKVFSVLRSVNVEPILIKGWAVARAYPQLALRPYGDIDVIVRRHDHQTASQAIERDARDCFVDFHAGVPFELADRSIEDVFSRSQLVTCGEAQVRVLSPEDHFALLAIHLLKHGAWRPLWLCDLGVLLGSMPNDFNWDRCLGKDRQRTNWILAAAGLAQKLLGASIRDEQISEKAREVPGWLVHRVLKEWETPFANAQSPQRHHAPINSYLRRPRGLLKDLARRWPNPISATISVNGTFGSRRRLRYEVGNWALRAGRVFANTFRTSSTLSAEQ